ncbi:RusA family crossover junction endodeoxyribonuclease [Salinispirillum sp. LH 10-3-1]|uniref:RusA family crossover junction endodeoxyribonuclease n=1 Tax=Salinispirillum sp. LH 10-3-1 TaxID=2952525 RepID=A0AB38YBZ8_9GAMM
MTRQTLSLVPVPKPRMTQRDRWQKRPAVMRYRAFCDHIRLLKAQLPPSGTHVTFVLPMPKSWSAKKKQAMNGKPHTQRPDADNMLKALCDAIHEEDSGIWDVRITKVWGESGQIIIDTPDVGLEVAA